MPGELLASFLITAWLCAGVACRRRRAVHVPMMLAGIVADLALLAVVETRARAIERVAAGVPVTVWIHVAIAVACLVGYGVAIWSGVRLWRNPAGPRRLHRANAACVLLLRLAVLLTTPGLVFPALPEAGR